jgi:DNA ligase D-like protein (predicted 3'-phosphoesterase)
MFVVHRHRTGRVHYDLRILFPDGALRSWSLLKEPPTRGGEKRLAVERESFPPQAAVARSIEERAFGHGKVSVWDEGEADIAMPSEGVLTFSFRGKRLAGPFELRRMKWYPGNHWLLTKISGHL